MAFNGVIASLKQRKNKKGKEAGDIFPANKFISQGSWVVRSRPEFRHQLL